MFGTCNRFIPGTVKYVISDEPKSPQRTQTQTQTSTLLKCVYVCVLSDCWLNEPIGLVCVPWEDKRIKGDGSVAITFVFTLRKFSPKALCTLCG